MFAYRHVLAGPEAFVTKPQFRKLHAAFEKARIHQFRTRQVTDFKRERTGELCVCQITEVLGLATSTVSAHLKELRRAGLTVERKEGRCVIDDREVTLVDLPGIYSLDASSLDEQVTRDYLLSHDADLVVNLVDLVLDKVLDLFGSATLPLPPP